MQVRSMSEEISGCRASQAAGQRPGKEMKTLLRHGAPASRAHEVAAVQTFLGLTKLEHNASEA